MSICHFLAVTKAELYRFSLKYFFIFSFVTESQCLCQFVPIVRLSTQLVDRHNWWSGQPLKPFTCFWLAFAVKVPQLLAIYIISDFPKWWWKWRLVYFIMPDLTFDLWEPFSFNRYRNLSKVTELHKHSLSKWWFAAKKEKNVTCDTGKILHSHFSQRRKSFDRWCYSLVHVVTTIFYSLPEEESPIVN